MADEVDVVVVGAGPAGLCTSRELTKAGVEHEVLERDRVGASWRGRWDSFCLVTPNDTVRLPGGEYRGPDPHGFMSRDAVVTHLEAYASGLQAPVCGGMEVTALGTADDGRLLLETSRGRILSRAVVACTGAYQRPHRPPAVAEMPSRVPVLDVTDYRRPHQLPDGAVMVVGSGQTGCQIAEELRLDGRDVVLVCGRAPWVPRRLEGRDIVDWIRETPFLEMTPEELPSLGARLAANFQSTGVRGGHDLSYRTLAAMGVVLTGHLAGVADGTAHFADDLDASVAFGDARYSDVRSLVVTARRRRGLPVPEMPDPAPFRSPGVDRLDLRSVASVVVAAGYRPAYGEWIDRPDAFDELGFPLHHDGASTAVPGLFFVGVHFLRKRKSSLLIGVGEDAAVVAKQVAGLVHA